MVDLTSAELQRLHNRLIENGLAPGSARAELLTISSACQHWVRQGWLGTNPIRGVEMSEGPAPTIDVLNVDELRGVLDALDGHRLRPLFELLAATGCRPGEALALTWDDINLAAGMVSINKSLGWTSSTKFHIGPPKTKAGIRSVPIPEQTVNRLRAWKRAQAEERLGLGLGRGGVDFVFATEDG